MILLAASSAIIPHNFIITKNKRCFHSCMKMIGHMPSLAKEVADLASIVFNAYFGLAQLAAIVFGIHTPASSI